MEEDYKVEKEAMTLYDKKEDTCGRSIRTQSTSQGACEAEEHLETHRLME